MDISYTDFEKLEKHEKKKVIFQRINLLNLSRTTERFLIDLVRVYGFEFNMSNAKIAKILRYSESHTRKLRAVLKKAGLLSSKYRYRTMDDREVGNDWNHYSINTKTIFALSQKAAKKTARAEVKTEEKPSVSAGDHIDKEGRSEVATKDIGKNISQSNEKDTAVTFDESLGFEMVNQEINPVTRKEHRWLQAIWKDFLSWARKPSYSLAISFVREGWSRMHRSQAMSEERDRHADSLVDYLRTKTRYKTRLNEKYVRMDYQLWEDMGRCPLPVTEAFSANVF